MTMKTKQDVILNYIEQFQKFGPQVVDCFSNGMCYWFAEILEKRFSWSNVQKVYDPVINHFAVEIDNRIYDIAGDITDDPQYKWTYWRTYQYEDPLHTKHIIRDCIDKIPNDIKTCAYCDKGYLDYHGNFICDIDNSPVNPHCPCGKEE